ncbi:PspA/IM30 family protein [Arthrobacter sp. H41]|uniref:PspA/IM30 family protein n=1 Tax=Arthrobacter sp. H41 TaxID=1312978 RepID=UPI00047CE781|nr:PspA/IM30 family protein [Arthrobacter sp. H41]
MSIKRRITRIVQANRAAAQAAKEDPQVNARQAQDQQQGLLDSARRAAADVAAHRRRIEIAASEAGAYAQYLDEQAATAVQRGDDETARNAIREGIGARKRHDTLTQQFSEADRQSRQLQGDLERLERRIFDSSLEYQSMVARRAAAEAALGVQESISASSTAAFGAEAARREAEREVRQLRAQAEAREELAWTDPSSPRMERAFEELEAEAEAQQELERLKKSQATGYRPGPQ